MKVPFHLLRENGEKTGVWRMGTRNTMALSYIMQSQTVNGRVITFAEADKAQAISPRLIGPLMRKKGITRVALGSQSQNLDYVTITADSAQRWPEIHADLEKTMIIINDFLKNNTLESVIDFSQLPGARTMLQLCDAFLAAGRPRHEAEMRAIISVVNNLVAADGGEIHFAGYDAKTQTLDVWLEGNCGGCDGSAMTVEKHLMNLFNRKKDDLEKPVTTLRIVEKKPLLILRV